MNETDAVNLEISERSRWTRTNLLSVEFPYWFSVCNKVVDRFFFLTTFIGIPFVYLKRISFFFGNEGFIRFE